LRCIAGLPAEGRMSTDFLSADEIKLLGFRHAGEAIRISRRAAFFAPERISIGRETRIDAFCALSAGPGGLTIGRNVHISAHNVIVGQASVDIGDFCTVSVQCSIFTSNDDYSGAAMANPTVPEIYRLAVDAPVRLEEHVIVGAGSVILCGVTIGKSAAVGALSLVKRDVPEFAIVAGSPARVIGERRRGHLNACRDFLSSQAAGLKGSPQ
jgi:acetyltransferase-like isoleucine patch superfamily enzyme